MTFVLALLVFMAIVAAMAVGVIFGRAPIKGSCGGLGVAGIDQECEICGGDPQGCESNMEPVAVRQYDPNQEGS
tara:strand:+ start:189 stop:410 length:222 start_codon:yes stop_codon:yes gene_type:complete